MKLRLRLISTLVFGALLSLPAAAQVPHITPFSADMHVASSHGGDSPAMNGKIYFTPNDMRMDMQGGPRGGSVLITNVATRPPTC